MIISKTLSRLLQGTQAIETSMEELKEFGIELGGAFYRVVTTDIDVYSSLYDTNDELKKESALMSFVVENISNEIVSDHNAGIAYRDSDSRVCMLLWSDNPKEFSQEIQVICREIQKTVKEAMQLSVSIGIGFCVEKLEELPKSYESAVATLKYRYTKGSGQVYDCESPMSCGNLLELEQDFKDIEEAAKNQQSEELMDILDHVEKWISHGYVTRNQAVSWLRQIMMIIYGVVRRANEDFQMDERDIGDVMESRSFTNAMEKVRAYVKRAMEAMEMAGQSSGERWARLALEYLKKNYGNPSLSLNDVCEHLNISTSRFSSVFKEATGKTFTEALNGIRMDRAKQLLRETSLKNYEIAEKVGFSDPHYFSIAFKKSTGLTPKPPANAPCLRKAWFSKHRTSDAENAAEWLPHDACGLPHVRHSCALPHHREHKNQHLNDSEKAPVSYLFAGEKFSVRLKVFYFFFFKKLMTALCIVAAEIPFLLCSIVFYRELSEKGLYKTVFAGAVALCSVLFLLGLYFGAVLSKTFWLCEKVYFKNKKCSVALAVNKSKSLTEGNRFRLVNYNISFAWRILFCIFLIPLFYTVPYISQSNGLLCREFIGKYRQGAAFPVVFMKLQKT